MANHMILLDVGGMGMLRKLVWRNRERYIRDVNRAVFLISDYHQAIWLWEGSNISAKTRVQAPRAAEKIMAQGYKLEGEVIGTNCKQVIVIDQAIMGGNSPDAQKMQAAYQQLFQIIQSLEVVPHENSDYIVTPTSTAAASAGTQEEKQDPRNENLAGILLSCILQQYKEAFVARTNQGVYQVETSAGAKFNFVFQNFQLKYMPNSHQIPESVMQIFQQLTQPK
ncbi:MAG: hypothetical protein ACTSRW_11545 [Candidatus Helarchaeota archaeon]